MKKEILNPNCSEYVQKLTLTAEELKFAKKFAKKFKLPDEDYVHLCEHFRDDRDSNFDFIEEGIDKPYTSTIEIIKEMRAEKTKNGKTKNKVEKKYKK